MKTLVKNNSNNFQSMPSLLNDLLADDWFNSSLSNWRGDGQTLPAVNIRETKEEFVLLVAAPGMSREQFKIELDNHILTVSSERQAGHDNSDGEIYTRREFNYVSFQRRFTLPKDYVDGDKVGATYVDGILQIRVPKNDRSKVKPVRQIKVS